MKILKQMNTEQQETKFNYNVYISKLFKNILEVEIRLDLGKIV